MTRIALFTTAAILIATPALADGYEPCPSCKTPDARPKVVRKAVKPKTRVVYVPRIVEKKVPVYVDHPVEVEKVVEVPVDRPVYVEKRVEVPVDRPVYVDRERVVEKRVEVPVDRPVYIDRPVYVDRTRTVVLERPVVERVEHYYESGHIRPYPATSRNINPDICGHEPDICDETHRRDCGCEVSENIDYSQYGNSRYGSYTDTNRTSSDISGHGNRPYPATSGHRYGSSYEAEMSEYESESSSYSSSYSGSAYGYGGGYGYGQWSGYEGYGYNVGQYSGINGAGGRWRQQNYRRR